MRRATASSTRTIATASPQTFHTSLPIRPSDCAAAIRPWDSRDGPKAIELDSDLANNVSYGRGRISTTYYSQEQTNGATPFSKTKSPVYIASERAEFRHESGQAIYSGNARAWQEDNYVRGDKLVLYVNDKRMEARRAGSNNYLQLETSCRKSVTVVPVFASADSMFYSDPDRTIHYEGNVDIKQEPIDSPAASPIFISPKSRTKCRKQSLNKTWC